jgi:type IV secretion system protein TrbB
MADRDLLLSLAGPILAGYLDDPALIEISCNDNGTCFLNRFGEGTTEVAHPGWGELERFLCLAAHEGGKVFSDRVPRLQVAFSDLGWRLQAGRPPISPNLFLSLRKHGDTIFTLDDYEQSGILTRQERGILETAMQTRQRLIIAGATGSAKTALGNALLDSIKDTTDRVIIVEDDPETITLIRNCTRMNVVDGQATLRELTRDSLRLAPMRIVVQEVRGGEALDMLKAFQTGHSGLTTLHVDRAEHTMSRLEACVTEVSTDPHRDLIGQVIDLVVHMAKRALSWRCTGILALRGYAQGAYHYEPLVEGG